jgi:hypothetical protein
VKDRTTVRRAAPGQWTITRPRIGFGPPETRTEPTAAAAWRWLRVVEKNRGGSAATDRAHNVADGLATLPRWDPWRYRYLPRRW